MALTLKQLLEESHSTVFLGGAGVSTGSGIPDFRSAHGIYHQEHQGPSYEKMLSIDYFIRHQEEFFRFYKSVMLYPHAEPNKAHLALAKLEQAGLLEAVITQNIDGLHQKAGSKNVLELHGSALRNFCLDCCRRYTMEEILAAPGVPRCSCGGVIRPSVVLYGEQLDPEVVERSVSLIQKADLLIVGGTSLVVYPAAGLVRYQKKGGRLCLINRTPTPYDDMADLVLREDIGQVLAEAAGL